MIYSYNIDGKPVYSHYDTCCGASGNGLATGQICNRSANHWGRHGYVRLDGQILVEWKDN